MLQLPSDLPTSFLKNHTKLFSSSFFFFVGVGNWNYAILSIASIAYFVMICSSHRRTFKCYMGFLHEFSCKHNVYCEKAVL